MPYQDDDRPHTGTVIAGNDKYFARVQVLKTVVGTSAARDACGHDVGGGIAPAIAGSASAVLEWALTEAKRLGIPVPK